MSFVLDVIVAGIAAGLVATVVMSALMMVMMEDDPMPTQLLVSKFVNDRPPDENMELGMALHLAYGTGAGVVLMGLAGLGGFGEDVLGTFAFGLLWGLILWFGALFWMGVLGTLSEMRRDPPEEVRKQIMGTLGMHLLYGATAGIVGAVVAGAL